MKLFVLFSLLLLGSSFAQLETLFVIDDFSIGQGDSLASSSSPLYQNFDFPLCDFHSLVGCSRDIKIEPSPKCSDFHRSSIVSDSSFPGAWSISSPDDILSINSIEYDGMNNHFEGIEHAEGTLSLSGDVEGTNDGVDITAGNAEPFLRFYYQSDIHSVFEFLFMDVSGGECVLSVEVAPTDVDAEVLIPFYKAIRRGCEVTKIGYILVSHSSSEAGVMNLKTLEVAGSQPVIVTPTSDTIWSLFQSSCIRWDPSLLGDSEFLSISFRHGENLKQITKVFSGIPVADEAYQWDQIHGITIGEIQILLSTDNKSVASEVFTLANPDVTGSLFCDQ